MLINFLSIIFLSSIVKKTIRYSEHDTKQEKTLIREGWQLSALAAFQLIVNKLDDLMLGIISPQLLALYYIGQKLSKFILTTVQSLMRVQAIHWAILEKKDNLSHNRVRRRRKRSLPILVKQERPSSGAIRERS